VFKWCAAGAAVVVIVPLALLFLVSATPEPNAASTGLAGGPSAVALADIPPSYLSLYLDAAQTCPRLPWGVLAGIGTVESDNGRSGAPGVHGGANFAGAEGPMQFKPATFSEYAVDADPGAPLSVYDPADAIYTAAAMLCASGAASGAQAGISQAVFAYNHSQALRRQRPGLGRPLHHSRARRGGSHRDLLRAGPARQAISVGRRRARCIRLLRPGLRRIRRRRHPHRPHHFPVVPRRPADPAGPDRTRGPAVLRWLGRHAGRSRSRRAVPGRRPVSSRPRRPARTSRSTRSTSPGSWWHPSRRPARQLNPPTGRT
jgi:Transglycosylase SLT domain